MASHARRASISIPLIAQLIGSVLAQAGASLHIRSNTGGFLTVWAMEGDGGVQLTPLDPDPGISGGGRWSGVLIAGDVEYVVPGHIQFTAGETSRRLIVIFSRSQTEQAHKAENAPKVLERLWARKEPDGTGWLLRESEDSMTGEVGTYVVNRRGMPVATEIILRSR